MKKGRDNGYMTKTDFLPGEGVIYVDTSGLAWVRHDSERTLRENKASLRRMAGFKKVFKRRSENGHHVIATPEILKEIWYNVKYYTNKKNGMEKVKRDVRSRRYGRTEYQFNFNSEDFQNAKRLIRAYTSIHEILAENTKYFVPRECIASDVVKKFVGHVNRAFLKNYLSIPDKGLVCAALSAGNDVGILSADKPLLKAYRAGAREFGLQRAFICDAMQGETFRAVEWEY
jgi:hypothetical protein|tara:strand:- start:765 stop:1454 length:690 start_codon:yes stop_codon:yes gene_type:complete